MLFICFLFVYWFIICLPAQDHKTLRQGLYLTLNRNSLLCWSALIRLYRVPGVWFGKALKQSHSGSIASVCRSWFYCSVAEGSWANLLSFLCLNPSISKMDITLDPNTLQSRARNWPLLPLLYRTRGLYGLGLVSTGHLPLPTPATEKVTRGYGRDMEQALLGSSGELGALSILVFGFMTSRK